LSFASLICVALFSGDDDDFQDKTEGD
jgi:hypothetical protein